MSPHIKPTKLLLVAGPAIAAAISAWPTFFLFPKPDLTPPWIARDTITGASWFVISIGWCFLLIKENAKHLPAITIIVLSCIPLLTLLVWDAIVAPELGMMSVYLRLAAILFDMARVLPLLTAFFICLRLAFLALKDSLIAPLD